METEKHIVKRPNETIGIVPNGKQRITHLVRRLYSVILLFSQKQGEQQEYAALLSDLLAAANSSGSNRSQVKEILRDIRAIGVDWNVRDGEREVWKNVGLIEEPGLIDGKGTPTIVTWKLPAIIRARLLDPRGFFTRISLEMMTRLRSGASIALYEICCQYASNDHGKGEGGLTNRGTIAAWTPRLTGSRKTDYEYKFFKRDVLTSAIDEINEITDLTVELIEHKHGRRVGELQFRVFRKQVFDSMRTLPVQKLTLVSVIPTVSGARPPKKKIPTASASALPAQPVVESIPAQDRQRMLAMGASGLTVERLCQKYAAQPDYLRRQLDFVESRMRSTTSAPLVNKLAFLQKALANGYADEKVVSPVATGIQGNAETTLKPEAIEKEKEILRRRAEVWQTFQASADEQEKAALVAAFLAQTSATLKTFYKKNGVNNMIVKASLTDWLMTEMNY
jgi:hypothetical protein